MIWTTVPIPRSYEPRDCNDGARTGRSRMHGLASFYPFTPSFPESCHAHHVLSYAALKPRFASTTSIEHTQ